MSKNSFNHSLKSHLLIAMAIVISFALYSCEEEDNQWLINANKASFGIIAFDYESQDLEWSHLVEYPSCESCGNDSIPLIMLYCSPGDFGSIAFQYTETADTLFFGTIIWMGRGQVQIPNITTPARDLDVQSKSPNEPLSIEYYHQGYYLDEAAYESVTNSLWESARKIDLVAAFAEGDYRIAFYLYPPTVGMFDPTQAKWLLFLYSD